MVHSRREFLSAAVAASAAAIPLTLSAAETRDGAESPDALLRCFDALPGDKSLKIYVPRTESRPRIVVKSNSGKMLFAASAIKTFVLCEAMRQADSPDIVEKLESRELALDDTVWSLGSPIFNPPNVTGIVSERTALEAMITRSDNTATDMIFKLAGADHVRKFVADAALTSTRVPDSTRALAGYVFGAPNYKTLTWEELLKVAQGPVVHPFLNDVETLASSADDLVSYYSRALRGEFFKHSETLNEYRRILSLCDFIYLVPLPLGISAYAKSGNADFPGFHARCVAGGMFVAGRWAYFAFLINWYSEDGEDAKTVSAFFSAINHALTWVRDTMST